jgi:hypothetical protein
MTDRRPARLAAVDVRLDASTLPGIASILDKRRERGVTRTRVDRQSSGSLDSRIDDAVRTPTTGTA